MARATVLVADRVEARRKELVRGLAALGYEVVAASDAAEGRRFEAGLDPDVVVAEAGLALSDPPQPGKARSTRAVRILLAGTEPQPSGGGVAVLSGDLTPELVLDRVRTALIAREIGVEAEPGLQGLVGDLQSVPVLELIPKLHGAKVAGCVLLGEGEIALDDGEVVASRVHATRGVKAFARLARTATGGFRVVLGRCGFEREIRDDVLGLMALAMEDGPRFDDAASRLPDLASRPRLMIGPSFFATQFSPVQQHLLTAVPECETVWDVVDGCTEPDGIVLEEVARLAELGFVSFDAPEVKVRVVTDSTADLPQELADRYDVLVIPASVIIGGEIFKDGIDLPSGDFFAAMERSKGRHTEALPPTRGEFLAAYRAVVARKDIVSVQPSAKLSKSFEHARQAVEEGSEDFRRVRGEGVPAIEVVDSMLASTPLALLVTVAARLAARRLPAREIRTRIEAMRPRVHALFAVDHPDYIARSGRVKGANALLGGLLGIKPLLGVRDGEIVGVEKVRGEANVAARLLELLKDAIEAERPVLVGIGHAGAPQAAIRLRSLVQEEFNVAELLENEIGPAVGLHVGPGCVGAAVFQPSDEELALIRTP